MYQARQTINIVHTTILDRISDNQSRLTWKHSRVASKNHGISMVSSEMGENALHQMHWTNFSQLNHNLYERTLHAPHT